MTFLLDLAFWFVFALGVPVFAVGLYLFVLMFTDGDTVKLGTAFKKRWR